MSGRSRRLVLLVSATIIVTACGENESSSADAARADSSAAGYAVGPRAPKVVSPADSSRDTTQRVAQAQAVTTGSTTAAVMPNGERAASAMGNGGPASGAKRPPADSAHKVAVATRTAPPNGATTNPKPDSTQPPPAPAGPVRVNEFLTYDARSRTVSLQLIAGYNGLNGSLNYNGATNGSHGISVPVGWRIHVAVLNRDSDLQHSAIVLREVLPPPIEPADPAFTGAALPDLGEGLQEDETGTLDFVADRAGQFMIACGVPGHAQAGMWLKLVVLKELAAPAYR